MRYNMTKKRTKESISKEQFESARIAREKNIENMKSWLIDKKLELESYELRLRELQLKLKHGLEAVNPVYKYELSDDWTQYMRDRVELLIKETQLQVDTGREAISQTESGLEDEELRLKLIKEGIPAWHDNEFERHRGE